MFLLFFFFNDTATTEIYTLSLHDALPISIYPAFIASVYALSRPDYRIVWYVQAVLNASLVFLLFHLGRLLRSEEHTSELQSRLHLVCRLLLEKKKTFTHQLP